MLRSPIWAWSLPSSHYQVFPWHSSFLSRLLRLGFALKPIARLIFDMIFNAKLFYCINLPLCFHFKVHVFIWRGFMSGWRCLFSGYIFSETHVFLVILIAFITHRLALITLWIAVFLLNGRGLHLFSDLSRLYIAIFNIFSTGSSILLYVLVCSR